MRVGAGQLAVVTEIGTFAGGCFHLGRAVQHRSPERHLHPLIHHASRLIKETR